MTKLETNALRIIELLYPDIDINGIEKYKDFFSTYNGLMPIVFECNSGISFGITIRPDDIMLHDYSRNKYWFDCNYKKEPEFIEALQLTCIKYLELKCQQLNIADNIE